MRPLRGRGTRRTRLPAVRIDVESNSRGLRQFSTFTCSIRALSWSRMAQGPGLQQVQRLSLQQILAPQLQQSLHLLQVSTLELNQLVHEELQQNPLLEEVA